MKYTAAATILFGSLAAAQSIGDIPSCALTCLLDAIGSVGCDLGSFECSCTKADQLIPSAQPCVEAACTDVADQEKTITVLEGICASAGFPIELPEPEEPAPEEPAPEEPAPEEPAPEEPTPEEPEKPEEEYPTEPEKPEEEYPTEPEKPEEEYPTEPTIQTSMPYPTATHPAPEETCTVVTYTETVTASKPGEEAPYPTGPVGTGKPVPVPSGSASYSAYPPEFTGAASSVKLSALAGVAGIAALLF